MIILDIFLILVGVLLMFWTGLIIGHKVGIWVGLFILGVGVILLLIHTGNINEVVDTLNSITEQPSQSGDLSV